MELLSLVSSLLPSFCITKQYNTALEVLKCITTALHLFRPEELNMCHMQVSPLFQQTVHWHNCQYFFLADLFPSCFKYLLSPVLCWYSSRWRFNAICHSNCKPCNCGTWSKQQFSLMTFITPLSLYRYLPTTWVWQPCCMDCWLIFIQQCCSWQMQ